MENGTSVSDTSFDFNSYYVSHDVQTVVGKLDESYSLTKRAFDFVVSFLITLFVLSWLIPLIGILIRLTSPGPILFVQLRTGYMGRPFRAFKFRTMRYSKDATFQQVTRNDNRITPIGRLLRKTGLDELPQFINVLLGDMSIVGPRPHPIPVDVMYWQSLPGYPNRYAVRPGITGLAQVLGTRGDNNPVHKMKRRIAYDKFYIKRHSILFDLEICWWTIKSMLKGDENAW